MTLDWVAIAAPAGGDAAAIIHAVLPRRTCLVRRAAGRADREQVIAANIDTLFVVTSANRDASARRIERYLTAAWDSGAAPVIVVNKIDLVEPRPLDLAQPVAIGRASRATPAARAAPPTASARPRS